MKKSYKLLVSLLILCLLYTPNSNINSVIAKTYKAKVYIYNYQGQQVLDSGDLKSAENYFKALLNKNPGNTDAKVGLADTFSAEYKLDAAEKNFKDILKSNPKHPGAHNGMGMVYYRRTTASNQNVRDKIQDYYQKAISEFKTALKFAPNYPDAHNNLGKIYQEQGDFDSAEKEYKSTLNIDPNNGNALVNLGTIYQARGEIDPAIDLYKKAIKLNSKNSTAHYSLGDAYLSQGKYDDAIKSLQTSLYQFPNSAPVHDKLGEVYEKQGNEAAAINEYRKAIGIKPEYTVSYLKLSSLFEKRGDDEFAISELRSAVNANPDFTEGKIKIADISTNIGKEEQAIKEYQDVLQTDPNNPEALKGLAKAYFNQARKQTVSGLMASPGDYVSAEIALKNALASQPNDLELHLALLRVAKLAGDTNVMQQEYNTITYKNPQNATDSVLRGEALFTVGKYRDSINEFTRALNFTNDPDQVLLLGDIFTVDGNLPLAVAAYNKALTLAPNNPKASKGIDRVKTLDNTAKETYRTGQGFFDEGQRFAAIDSLRKAMGINSVEPMTRWMLAESYRKEDFFNNAIAEYKAYLDLSQGLDQKTIEKTQKQIESLTKKVNKMMANGQPVKDYDQYVSVNKKKY